MLESSPSQTSALARRLIIHYLAALGMIAVLTILGQIVVQQAIIQLEGDSRIVNIAGRQRMLSQRLTRLTFDLAYFNESFQSNSLGQSEAASFVSSQAHLATIIRKDLNTWTKNHEGLRLGSEVLKLPGKNSESVLKLFNKLAPHFETLGGIIESALVKHSSGEDAILDAVVRKELSFHSDAFLVGMDDIVTRLEQEARDRVSRLRWIESALLFGTIAVLICEGLFIFSPAVASLRRSLTQLHKVSDALEKAKVIAEKANMAKTDFLAKVSHELRTPLHAILGMLGLVVQTKLSTNQSSKIRLAIDASTSLLSLVDDLLDVASIEKGNEIILYPAVVDLHGLLISTAEVMRPMAIQKGLQFQLTLDDALPNLVTVAADRVRQILTNLLQNAIRYTSNGFVHCNVDTQTEANQVFLRLVVEDTGAGISKEDQESIFTSFSRRNHDDSSIAFGRGLGLGLAITQSMVAKLNGSIVLSSDVGKGSRFTVVLPIQLVPEDEQPIAPPPNQADPWPNRFLAIEAAQPTALIVDDSHGNLLVMRSYLKLLGYRTMSVSSLKASVLRARKHRFDLVLMDRQLPDGDGLDFPKMLRDFLQGKAQPDARFRLAATKVFLVTAEIHLQSIADVRMAPFAGVLYKPVSLFDLKRAIAVSNQSEFSKLSGGIEQGFAILRKKLAADFIRLFPTELDRIRSKFEAGDYSAIEFIAHRILGSAGNAGLIDVAQLAKELHNAALEMRIGDMDELLLKLADNRLWIEPTTMLVPQQEKNRID